MSLLVWLPLNGNDNNYGLNKVTLTGNGGTATYLDGKIGKCLLVNGRYITISPITLGSEASVCYWSKTTVNGKMVWTSSAFSEKLNIYENNIYTLNIGDGNNNPFKNNGSKINVLHDGLWHHFAVTFGNNESKLYIDGEYRGTAINFRSPAITNGQIKLAGGYDKTHTYDWNGSIDDFRVYDHCLSPKEIKEISKGLVLHYKLDNNDISLSQNLITGFVKGGQTTISGNNIVISGNNSDTYFRIKTSKTLTLNKQYKLSCIGTGFNNNAYYNFPIAAQSNTSPGVIKIQNGYCELIFIANEVIINAGTSILLDDAGRSPSAGTITNIVLQEYTDIIYDCSGYENNGNILSTIILNQDSSRYNYSFEFNGDTSGIIVKNLNIGNIINTAMSYSFWIKPNGENGARSVYFSSYSGTSFSIEKTASNKLRLWWNGSPDLTSNLTITDNQWQHIVITKTGTTEIKVYLNGILIQTLTNTYNNVTFPTTYRIGRDTRTGTTSYKGLMSDFRIYATALSDEDIKELYNTSAIIDNNLNFYTLEFQELNNSRELIGALHAFYRSTGSGSNPVKNSDGSITINGHTWLKSDPLWSGYIPINPVGKTYYYDIEYSNNEGNLFYIGFSKYDANKGTGSNEECQYVVSRKTAVDHKRVSGIINLSTANGNTAAFTQVRVLNQWTGSTSGVAGVSTIYHLSLREVEGTPETLLINKNGISLSDEFTELNSTEVRKNGITTINQLIEI